MSSRMKVGIITYHFHHNYGTMLQALALQKKIEAMGYSSEIIDYRMLDILDTKCDVLKTRFRRFSVYILQFKKYYTKFVNRKNVDIRGHLFDLFFKNYIVTGNKEYTTLEMLKEDIPLYDAYIVGSDQTWNPEVSTFSEAFFLSFAPKSSLRGSYAPSVSIDNFTEQQKQKIKDLIKNIDYISCREEKGSVLLRELTNKEVTTVIDPTLLLTAKEWESYMSNDIPNNEPYILAYFLGDNMDCRVFTKNLSQKTGYKVICLPFVDIDMRETSFKKLYNAGPGEYLSLIKGAEYICTDSFHGTIFSINFEKQFYVFTKHSDNQKISENSRIYHILSIFELNDRLRKSSKLPELSVTVDYKKVKERLRLLRENSLTYLKMMLSKVER